MSSGCCYGKLGWTVTENGVVKLIMGILRWNLLSVLGSFFLIKSVVREKQIQFLEENNLRQGLHRGPPIASHGIRQPSHEGVGKNPHFLCVF